MSEKIKVRITKCTGDWWYATEIGKEFEVEVTRTKTSFHVTDSHPVEFGYGIQESDCEIISEKKNYVKASSQKPKEKAQELLFHYFEILKDVNYNYLKAKQCAIFFVNGILEHMNEIKTFEYHFGKSIAYWRDVLDELESPEIKLIQMIPKEKTDDVQQETITIKKDIVIPKGTTVTMSLFQIKTQNEIIVTQGSKLIRKGCNVIVLAIEDNGVQQTHKMVSCDHDIFCLLWEKAIEDGNEIMVTQHKD